MKRLATLVACLGAIPASVRAQESTPTPAVPVIPSVATPVGTTTAAPAVSPAVIPGRTFSPSLYPPLSPSPTLDCLYLDDSGRVVGCPTTAKAGVAARLNPLHWFHHDGCEDACPICGTKRHLRLREHAGHCAADGCPAGGCGCGDDGRSCWGKFKDWLCYNPCYARTMPIFKTTPYQTPFIRYFGYQCMEPRYVSAPACWPEGHGKGKHGKQGCEQVVVQAGTAAPQAGPTTPGVMTATGEADPATTPTAKTPVQPSTAFPLPGLRFANPLPAGATPPVVTPPATTGQPAMPTTGPATRPWPAAAQPVSQPVSVVRPFTTP